jgi:hypothetical protein
VPNLYRAVDPALACCLYLSSSQRIENSTHKQNGLYTAKMSAKRSLCTGAVLIGTQPLLQSFLSDREAHNEGFFLVAHRRREETEGVGTFPCIS